MEKPDPQTTGPLPFYRDADDIVAAGIAADLAAGRCWACRCEQGQPHASNCPEAESHG